MADRLLTSIILAFALWWGLRPAGLPSSIVSGNGRLEAIEINIATKTPGRIIEILAREGDFVTAGIYWPAWTRKCY